MIIYFFHAVSLEKGFECNDDFKDMFLYTANYWMEILKTIDKQEIIDVLKLCHPQTLKDIESLTRSIDQISNDIVDKFLEAKSML